jgi:glycosyltransferase involved in cell wall biosynthesis
MGVAGLAVPEGGSRYGDDAWLVMPVYNESSVIGEVVAGARRRFPNIICVDDGSTDGSGEVARLAGARVVRHAINLGQGAALQTGFEYALTVPAMRYVVTFDSDGQHQVADVEAMLDRLVDDDLDVVLGSRFLDKRTQGSRVKRLALRAGVLYTNATARMKLTDTHNGLRVRRRSVVSRLRIHQNRMAHASELIEQIGTMRIDGRPVRYAEHPVHVLYTDYSTAKGQSVWNSVNILADLMVK